MDLHQCVSTHFECKFEQPLFHGKYLGKSTKDTWCKQVCLCNLALYLMNRSVPLLVMKEGTLLCVEVFIVSIWLFCGVSRDLRKERNASKG
jgi:hypothetical protein